MKIKSDASTLSSKRHQINIYLLKFLLNVLYKNLEKPIPNNNEMTNPHGKLK